MIRAAVNPAILTWARERAGLEPEDLTRRFAKLAAWEKGDAVPTLRQLEQFAKAVHVPIGYLFLREPLVETIPIPDFRLGRANRGRPSPNLLDTIYMCQGRQEWYRDYARIAGETSKEFVGSLTVKTGITEAAEQIRHVLGFDVDARRDCPTWTDALRMFVAQAEAAGVLVMCSGVVYNNTHRSLDPDEFRGFAIADPLAPLIFVNAADTKSAQMFTLAHELGHLWLGQSALTDTAPSTAPTGDVEAWCNRVAAELLVPEAVLSQEIRSGEVLDATIRRLARRFKVSTLVVLRRLHDIGILSSAGFHTAYEAELKHLLSIDRGSGGDFHVTEGVRVSKRFALALVESTLEGQTLYRDAMQMLGISKLETFAEFGRRLEFQI
jgi:Zn-dependent peptidase ImmA (M78 family)